MDSKTLVFEPSNAPKGLGPSSCIREGSENEEGYAKGVSWCTIVLTSVTLLKRHHEDWIAPSFYLILHVLELSCRCLVSDRQDELKSAKLLVFITFGVHEYRLTLSQLFDFCLPLGK